MGNKIVNSSYVDVEFSAVARATLPGVLIVPNAVSDEIECGFAVRVQFVRTRWVDGTSGQFIGRH